MYSGEGEEVAFRESLYPNGNVEDWMLEIERTMKESLRLIIKDSLSDYKTVSVLLSYALPQHEDHSNFTQVGTLLLY